MSMPKGHKMEHGYFTVSSFGGMGFRQIAEIMTASGEKMNQATARNVFLRALKKIALPMMEMHPESERDLDEVIKDPRFQHAVMGFIRET